MYNGLTGSYSGLEVRFEEMGGPEHHCSLFDLFEARVGVHGWHMSGLTELSTEWKRIQLC